MIRLVFFKIYLLFCFVFFLIDVLQASWICGLLSEIIFAKFSSSFNSNIFSVLFSFDSLSGFPFTHIVHFLEFSHNSSTFYSFIPFFPF